MQRTRCRLFSCRLSLSLSLSSSSAKWDEHSRVSQGACVGLTFCDCWKSKSLTRNFPMKNSEESVLSSTSTTLLYESHFAYNHPVKHRALPRGLSVSKTSVLQMKQYSLKSAKCIEQPTWTLEFQLGSLGLLAKCSSRKEGEKRFQMSGWKAVTTDRSFTLSALTVPSGCNLAIAQCQRLSFGTCCRVRSLIFTYTLNESCKVLLQNAWGFQYSPWIATFTYPFLLLQHLCARLDPPHCSTTLLSSSFPSDAS